MPLNINCVLTVLETRSAFVVCPRRPS